MTIFLIRLHSSFFFIPDTSTTDIYTLSLHDALPISPDQFVSIQVGGYIFDSYRKQVNDNEPLKIVLHFLYYHGKEPWTPPELSELFTVTPKAIHKYVPEFEIMFENIQNYSHEQIGLLGCGLFTSAILA